MPPNLQFIFQPETQLLFDHFCGLLGVRIAFFSPEGEVLRIGKELPSCPYCKILRFRLGYDAMCRTLDENVRKEVARTGNLKSYVCHGGMTEAVMPVIISGRIIGYIMIGQFRRRKNPPSNVIEKAPGKLEKRLARAYELSPLLTDSQAKHTLGMLELLVHYISDRRLVNIRDSAQVILDLLREKPEEHLSLNQAAAMAGCSSSTLSRLFRNMFGESYNQMRIRLLLEKAERIFRETPDIQVQQVAYKLGFDDPLYFSRLYKNKRGICARNARQGPPVANRKKNSARRP